MSNEETARITSIPEVDELVREQESPSIELAPRRPKENRVRYFINTYSYHCVHVCVYKR